MKRVFFNLIILFTLFSCEKPESKLWKHGVYSKYEAQELEGLFEGLEVDVIYSPEKNDIYVGRVEADTSKNLPLNEWLAMLKEPSKTYYWIDFKNLSYKNANQVFDVLNPLVDKYGIKDVAFVESQDLEALKIAERMDLVGFDKHCLIRPRQDKKYGRPTSNKPDAKKEVSKKVVPKKKKAIRNVHKKKR